MFRKILVFSLKLLLLTTQISGETSPKILNQGLPIPYESSKIIWITLSNQELFLASILNGDLKCLLSKNGGQTFQSVDPLVAWGIDAGNCRNPFVSTNLQGLKTLTFLCEKNLTTYLAVITFKLVKGQVKLDCEYTLFPGAKGMEVFDLNLTSFYFLTMDEGVDVYRKNRSLNNLTYLGRVVEPGQYQKCSFFSKPESNLENRPFCDFLFQDKLGQDSLVTYSLDQSTLVKENYFQKKSILNFTRFSDSSDNYMSIVTQSDGVIYQVRPSSWEQVDQIVFPEKVTAIATSKTKDRMLLSCKTENSVEILLYDFLGKRFFRSSLPPAFWNRTIVSAQIGGEWGVFEPLTPSPELYIFQSKDTQNIKKVPIRMPDNWKPDIFQDVYSPVYGMFYAIEKKKTMGPFSISMELQILENLDFEEDTENMFSNEVLLLNTNGLFSWNVNGKNYLAKGQIFDGKFLIDENNLLWWVSL